MAVTAIVNDRESHDFNLGSYRANGGDVKRGAGASGLGTGSISKGVRSHDEPC
jgi:hypothetical protein